VSAAPKQLALGDLQTEAEEAAEIEAGYLWRAALWGSMRQFVIGYIGPNGLKGYDAAAAALDKRWGPHGRGVSASALRAALLDSDRNNFRLEWADWFAARSPEIAELMARRVKPVKSAEERLADLEAEIRAELPKRADAVIRNSRAR
jgi:hypothetical protein